MLRFSKFLVVILLSLSAKTLLACSCYPLPPIYRAFVEADAVFTGKVISSNQESLIESSGDVIFVFDVIEAFKGVKAKQVTLNRGRRDSSCYSGYEVGQTYLIYADSKGASFIFNNPGQEAGTVFQGSFCNRSTTLGDASDQIFYLKQLLSGKPENQIYGSVKRSDADPDTYKSRRTYLDKIKVILEAENSKSFETLTDSDGRFSFNKIPPGSYVLKPVLPAPYRHYWPGSETINVLDDKTIGTSSGYLEQGYTAFYTDFTVGWSNFCEGKVNDENGRAFDRYVVRLLPVDRANMEMVSEYREGSPDPHTSGKFDLYGFTPGRYVAAVDIYAPFGNSVRKRFFYGQSDTAKYTVLDVADTTKLTDLSIKIPLRIVEISGEASWSDGTPMAQRAWISLNALETPDEKLNTSFDWKSADNGRFSFQAIHGLEYWIHSEVMVAVFESGKEIYKDINVRPFKVKAGSNGANLKIIFEKPSNLVVKQNSR